MRVAVGDRVEVTGIMDDEPQPMAVGSQGVVEGVHNVGTQFAQIEVKWDSGRTLFLLPHDPFRKVGA